MAHGLIKGISLSELDACKIMNGHFVDDLFLIDLEDQTSMENTIDCL
jgi:hypothetical protein